MSDTLAAAVVAAVRAVPAVVQMYPATSPMKRVAGLMRREGPSDPATLVRMLATPDGRLGVALSVGVSSARSAAETAREINAAVLAALRSAGHDALRSAGHGASRSAGHGAESDRPPEVTVTVSHIVDAPQRNANGAVGVGGH